MMAGMRGGLNRGRDLAGWLGATAVTALLFAGAAGAALRAMPSAVGEGEMTAVALDLSVGIVPLSAAIPSAPPVVAGMTTPGQPKAVRAEAAPDLPLAEPEPAGRVLPEPPPVLDLPQAEAAPVMASVPPLPPERAVPQMAESPRPMARPERDRRAARETAPVPENAPPAAAQVAQPAGAEQAARPAQERRAAGGQTAAQYGDQVMRQIARLRRQKAPERGTVTVGFEIGADGGLRRVAVVSSSGSEALDLVALDHIRRAAPFPPPPAGAAVRFAFEFVGR